MKSDNVFIIAEAGVNHNGDLDLALQMIDAAAHAGADAVKFQVFVAEQVVTPDVPLSEYQKENMSKQTSYLEMLKRYELSRNDLVRLIEHAKEKNIMLLATPFDKRSVDVLVELKRPYLKIDSASIVNHPFLEYAAGKGIPLIVSTGASTMDEVREAVAVIEKYHRNIALLHCTAMYPAPHELVNLFAIKSMMQEFDYPIGYSDHTIGIEVAVAAVAMGATIIEKHFTLDRSLEGPDHKVSLQPDELTAMVRLIRNVEKAKGDAEKKPCDEEIKIMEKGRSSIIAASDLKKGAVLSEQDIVIKRPGTGITPKHFKDVLGKKLARDIKKDTPLQYADIEGKI